LGLTSRRHRLKELPLDSGEREDGDVDDGDDRLAEHAGGSHLERRLLDDLEALTGAEQAALCALLLREPPNGVFDDDHRAVHDEPEVDGPEAHQVA
jgi:hypothetical protein